MDGWIEMDTQENIMNDNLLSREQERSILQIKLMLNIQIYHLDMK